MSLLFFITGNVFLICILIFSYWVHRHKITTLKKILKTIEVENTQLNHAQKNLQAELQNYQNQLRQTGEDPITKVLSWQFFEDRLKQNIKESERYQLTPAVMFIDIDNFKVINDALGFEVGDAVLLEVSKRLQECIRQVDSISRFSKDTFVVLLAQLSKPETAAIVAQRMLQSITEVFIIHRQELYITACIGIAIYPNDGREVAELLRNAEHALHLAKMKGQHNYQFYQERMHAESQRELILHTSLSRENVFQEFVLYYQPVIQVKNNTIFCMDIFLHWSIQGMGLIGAEELFNIAEKQRKQNMITEWILQNACKHFLSWKKSGLAPQYLGLTLSIKQLENSHFIYRISQIMQELAFDPTWLLLEIKDTPMASSFDVLEKAFNMLKYLGVKLALNDFGSSTFSILHLKQMSIDFLKLDRALIDGILENAQTRNLIKSLVNLANNMSLEIIAQGIDAKEQADLLASLGCQLMQGSYFGEPLPEPEIYKKMVTLPVE